MSEQVPPTRLREGAAAEAALVDTIFNRLQTAQEALLAGRSSVTAQAFIIAVWTEAHPVASAIAVARFLNGGRVAMRERLP